jgi:hypothetical protein
MKLLGSLRLSMDDHRALFLAAGYEGVEIAEERRRGWICAIGTKPAGLRSWLSQQAHGPPHLRRILLLENSDRETELMRS